LKNGYILYTPVTFSKLNALHDRRKGTTREFVTLGGQNGKDSYYLSEFPQLKNDARYLVVFVPTQDQATAQLAQGSLEAYSAFPIDSNNAVTLQEPSSPNEPGGGTQQPKVTVPLDQAQQTLKSCAS
jgi:hypothetical protein